jgi:hypothetical protein
MFLNIGNKIKPVYRSVYFAKTTTQILEVARSEREVKKRTVRIVFPR